MTNIGASQLYTVTYDGECGLCRRFIRWLESRDRSRQLRSAPYQDLHLSARLRNRAQHTILLTHPDERVEERVRAILRLFQLLGFKWLGWLRLPPIVDLADLAYCWIAAHRRWVSHWLHQRQR